MALVYNSRQIFLYSLYASVINTTRNRCTFQLAEPIHAPDGYHIHCTVLDAQLPINGSVGTHLFFLVGSNFNDYNSCTINTSGAVQGRFLAKIPNNAVVGYICSFTNINGFSSVLADKTIQQIELHILAENGTDINFNTSDWAMTLQFEIVKIKS